MQTTLLCLALAATGIEYGHRPLPEGGMEYIIQIEPHVWESMKEGGNPISSVPFEWLRGVDKVRIQVGTGTVERLGGPEDIRVPAAPIADPKVPRPLPDHTVSSPFEGLPAVFMEETEPGQEELSNAADEEADSNKPWLTLILALTGFCGSFAGMLYFGWIAYDYRSRYRRLLSDVGGPDLALPMDRPEQASSQALG